MSGMAESYSSKLADITLPDPEGQTTRLGSLWEKGPTVLVFIRHYG
jgi:peroxiredoxin